MEKENNSKANKAKSTSASNSTNSKAKRNPKAKNERTDSKISDNAIKDTNKANKSNLKASQTENDVKPEEKRDDLTLASQEEKIKKNAGKDSKRKKAAVTTAIVLLLIAGVTVPTAVYLARRKVTVDVETNVEIIEEYTINVKRGVTIKDIVPQEIKGYTFVGFFKDAALTNPYKDTDKINKDTTIYAKYEANIYKVTLPTSPSFTIEGEGIVDNQVEVEYNSEYSFKLELNPGYEESDIIVKVNGEALTPDQEGYYTITINGDMVIEVEGVEINTYEVTFYDSLEKNEIYQNQEIQYNQLCTYTGVMPTKTNTHTYKYTFIGWVNAEGEVVDLTTTRIVSNLELFANFKEEYIEYSIHKPEQVNIQNEEGIYLSNTATLHYGDIVTITYDTTQGYDVTAFEVNGAEKVAGSENQYRITGNLEVIYTEEIQTFTVSIAVNNADYGTVSESSITVDYGTAISVNGNQLTIGDTTITAIPTTDNPTYDYAFTGWTNTASEVTEAITIIANFEMTMDEYEVTIAVNEASYGTINLSTVTVNYDTPITVEDNKLTINGQEIIATPTASDAQYTYAFGNWTIDDIEVTSASKIQTDLTITANFTRTVNTYTVTWLNWDGSTLETDQDVAYGMTPTYDGATPTRTDATYAYEFTGWSPAVSSVTGDVTYTAQFDQVAELLPYEINASGEITKYTGTATEVEIPSTYSLLEDGTIIEGSDHTVTGIAYASKSSAGAFANTNITSVTIPDSVTSIGSYAFYRCESLTSITIPDSVTSIGYEAFEYCTRLTSVTIGEGVTSIGERAFSDCSSLGSIIVDEGNAVYHSDGNCLIETGSKTLIVGCKTSIIPSDGSVTSIGIWAFSDCTSLESITIPSSVTSIGKYAFSDCSSLTSITIGEGVTSIGYDAFSGCISLTDIYYTGDINDWVHINFAKRDDTDFYYIAYSNPLYYANNLYVNGNELVTEANINTSINAFAFFGYDKLTSVTLGDQVTSIGYGAFYNCNNLTDVYYTGDINDWVSIRFNIYNDWGSYNDNYNSNPLSNGANLYVNGNELVTEANIDTATSISALAFYRCTSITSVIIGEQVTSIGERAFYNCNKLTSVTIGDSVTSIGDSAFSSCYSLAYIVNKSSVEFNVGSYGTSTSANPILEIVSDESEVVFVDIDGNRYKDYNEERYFIKNLDGSSEIEIDSSCTQIYQYAFYGRADITSVSIPDSVTSIGSYAFYSCDSLTSITIPDSVTSIGSYAFSGCSSLTSITIPDSVTSIGYRAFEDCTSLTSVTIGEGVTSIENWAFDGCSSLTSITIPDSVTSIGNYAFDGCYSLVYVVNKSALEFNVGDYGTSRSDSPILEIVSDESEVVFVDIDGNRYKDYNEERYFIKNLDGSSEIEIDSSCTQIYQYAFYDRDDITSVSIPDSVTSIGDYAFYGCSSLTSITIPDSVTSIRDYAFYNCTSLTSITIPDSVTSIGNFAFADCSSLTSITIPDSVTSIGNSAFEDCSSLTSITIGEGVTSIISWAFDGCSSLTSVTIESNYAYANAGTGYNQCGYLLENATEVRVLTSCIGDSTNSYLENANNFTKTTSEDGLYYIYTKV